MRQRGRAGFRRHGPRQSDEQAEQWHGTIKLVAIVAGKDLNGLGVDDATFTCTGTLKRTSTEDPAVGECPILMGTMR